MTESTEQEYINKIKAETISLEYVPADMRTERVCLVAVRLNGNDLKFVENQTENICLTAVKRYGCGLKFVKEQTYEICLAAVKNNGLVLEYVENQTDEMCLAAVRNWGGSLQHVKKQTKEICLEAVKQNGFALGYVKNQTDEICLAAVAKAGSALKYVKNQTEEIYKKALTTNQSSLIYIDVNIYKYDKSEILNAFNASKLKFSEFKFSGELKLISDKIVEVLNRLDDGKLVDAVNIDLKEIFTEENLKLNDGLANIKSKADIISGIGNTGKINIFDKKLKII